MNEADALDLARAAIWMTIVGAGPAVGAAMVIGVAVALIQALTRVQEMTLTTVPKIVAVLAVIYLTASFVGGQFGIFTSNVYSRIETGFPK
jgi:flagellar biosynthesis protein FliQ